MAIKKNVSNKAAAPAVSKSVATAKSVAKSSSAQSRGASKKSSPSATIAAAPKGSSAKDKQAVSAFFPTVINAFIDVGFGNTLFIRGDGPGLSWEKGVELDCIADNQWSVSLSKVTRPIAFKVLINDATWCAGEDYVVEAGSTLTLTPSF